MLSLNPNASSLIEKPKPVTTSDFTGTEDFNVGIDFENQIIVVEAEAPTTTILTLPIHVAYPLALKMLEACAITNFSNKMGLKFDNQAEESVNE